MRKKETILAAAALVVVVTGCSSSHRGAANSTTSTSTTVGTSNSSSSSSVGTSAPATTASGATTATTAPSGPQPCPTASLSASLGQPSGAAGTVYYQLVLQNTGKVACTLAGYPGVSFVSAAGGSQVGAAAVRTPGTVATVTVEPGQSADAPLGITEAANFGSSCQITTVPGLRVYPPGQTVALFVAHTDQTCANPADATLRVKPVTSA